MPWTRSPRANDAAAARTVTHHLIEGRHAVRLLADKAKTMSYGRTKSKDYLSRTARLALVISGTLFSPIGVVLALGGYLSPEGSAFDVLAGLGLIASGALFSARRVAKTCTDTLVFAATLGRSLINIAVGSRLVRRVRGFSAADDRDAGPSDCLRCAIAGSQDVGASTVIYTQHISLWAIDHSMVRLVPPAAIEEAGWDILLALHSDRHCRLNLSKLTSVVGVPGAVMERWLGALEERELITGAQQASTGEILAVLTDKARELLDCYFSATKDLQVGARLNAF